MIRTSCSVPVGVSAPEAFDVIGTHVYENHPKWEAEVLEIRPLTPGPVAVGSEALMVRQDGRRRTETVYRVTGLEPGRRIAFEHPAAAMGFWLTFTVTPTGATSSTVQVDVAAQPRGALRVMEPLMRLGFPRRTTRIATRMGEVVEEVTRSAAAPGRR